LIFTLIEGSVSKVEIATPMDLIHKVLFPSISTFETPPQGDTTERHAYDPLKAGPRDADEEDSGRIDPGGRGEGMRSVAPWCTRLDLSWGRKEGRRR
jgi:hypothetical protein